MTSQMVIFKTFFFFFFFFVPLTLNLKKIPINQLIKKIWPKEDIVNDLQNL